MGLLGIILAAFLSITIVALYIGIRTAFDYVHRPKEATLRTNLKEFKESSTIDNRVKKSGNPTKRPTSIEFEDRCVTNPEDSEDLEYLARKYSDYLYARILDPEAKNAPSEFIEDEFNEDYFKYLKNQKSALQKNGIDVSWFKKEIARVKGNKNYDRVKEGFIDTLTGEYRMPEDLVGYAVTDERMESFSKKDWRNLSRALRSYGKDFREEVIGSFLITFDDLNILTDYDSMEKFNMWYNHGVPEEVIKINIEDNMPDDMVMKMVRLVDEEYYSWTEAMKSTIKDNMQHIKNEKLRAKYRNIVKKG